MVGRRRLVSPRKAASSRRQAEYTSESFRAECQSVHQLFNENVERYDEAIVLGGMNLKVPFKLIELHFEKMKSLDEELNAVCAPAEAHEFRVQFSRIAGEFFRVQDDYESRTSRQERPLAAAAEQKELKQEKSRTLPKIEFRQFSGDPKDWLSFWAQFQRVDEDVTISRADKVQYLIMATTPGGRARQLVESYPHSGDNYVSIIDALKSRFGRKELQTEIQIREMLKLIIATATSERNIPLATLYDRVESRLRALETIGVPMKGCAPILYPMVESCLSESLLRTWHRSIEHRAFQGEVDENYFHSKLQGLLKFLETEANDDLAVEIVQEGLGLNKKCPRQALSKDASIPTASTLFSEERAPRCVFCTKNHTTSECCSQDNVPMETRREVLFKNGLCFRCAKKGHLSKDCMVRIKCSSCGGSHMRVVCGKCAKISDLGPNVTHNQQAILSRSGYRVLLQTLKVYTAKSSCNRKVRLLLDSGAQRSYILNSTAQNLGLKSVCQEKLRHALFGGKVTSEQIHKRYDIVLRYKTFWYNLEVLGQDKICGDISAVPEGPWLKELEEEGIELQDVGEVMPIDILVGADVLGDLLTGNVKKLSCGLTAVETELGWTLLGKVPESLSSMQETVLTIQTLPSEDLRKLWELEALGIEDPVQKACEQAEAEAARELFLQTLRVNAEGRYEICLPWRLDHKLLPNYKGLAQKRLDRILTSLYAKDVYDRYDQVFEEWLAEGIIEEVNSDNPVSWEHYLPHHPVIKEDRSTTKVRPVFDASAKEKGKPSLNDCLEKGVNLIKLIPNILVRFRLRKVGISSDIRKAFLQISVRERDRDMLRFLWVGKDKKLKIYRHRRVVFGINCSPFMLGATIEYHLNQCMQKDNVDIHPTVRLLQKAFYVDNCLTSVDSQSAAAVFREQAENVLGWGGFDLRAWAFSGTSGEEPDEMSVLGLVWNRREDTLALRIKLPEITGVVTRRTLMSLVQKVFDPIGFTSPVTINAKQMLQHLWGKGSNWDSPLDKETVKRFYKWFEQLKDLVDVRIPRWLYYGDNVCTSIHVFCDASQKAYAAVIYLRVEKGVTTNVGLVAAKARVAPLKAMTMPRLELMAATIGSRLYKSLFEGFEIPHEVYFWSDSTTVLAWIHRVEEWSPFVGNRVREIRSLTNSARWRFVPGAHNPADLPTRGCTAKHLQKTRWWEGPSWLKNFEYEWSYASKQEDEKEIASERKKKRVVCMINLDVITNLRLNYFGSYRKNVRMLGWILRFSWNMLHSGEKRSGGLSVMEIAQAEIVAFKAIQKGSLLDLNNERIRQLQPFVDEKGLIRLRSRVSARKDTKDFRYPIVLPGEHTLVEALIRERHIELGHMGSMWLLNTLREHYWILGGRKAIRKIVAKCVTCQRYAAQPISADVTPLPVDRVCDSRVFEVVGIDFAGPLLIRGGTKVYVCLFTCAVYRAVHLELSTSISSTAFMLCLRRFIARRGNPKRIYSDNGRGFVGARNALLKTQAIYRIEWCLSPPDAPWWGGFWERLVGLLKRILRKILGRASVSFEELATILCDCEHFLNSRPLTPVSEDPSDLEALTPNSFIRDPSSETTAQTDQIDDRFLCRRAKYRRQLQSVFKSRFRIEYLGYLKMLQRKVASKPVTVGELVLLKNDEKRVNWSLARVVELMPGKDGNIRVVRLRTPKGQLIRPVQRLYRLECS